ncbi:peroxin-5 [Tribonema minus]|uniref:Peroxin-5 n=1 Tax=Tribonema minus TaxID=303371 RepID=A0A836CKH3_9STRA|nr:peroxin-5 [Tribonema minus]
MLGQSHAENDQDRLAIGCLERSVEADPYNLEALLALGVSYVNELDSARALRNLKAWVEHNPKYAGLELKQDAYSDGTLMDEVMQLMRSAEQWDFVMQLMHSAEQWDTADADVKVVLGVLFNVSRDYDAAVGAFREALRLRPEDHSLWNKLGATLANSNRSEEALPVYEEALKRKPKYARAWLNLGISQANLSRYEQAASCYMRALTLNPAAKHIWAYLRIVFTSMDRFDLVQKAAAEDVTVFDGEFPATAPNSGVQFDSVW